MNKKKLSNGIKHIFKTCHQILVVAGNNYLQEFIQVNEYIENNKLEMEDVSICIDACFPSNLDIHLGRLNVPTAPDVAVLMPIVWKSYII